jgi:LPS export ABC transporter protein LptC
LNKKNIVKRNAYILMLFLALSAFLFSCENDIEVVKSLANTQDLPVYSSENIEIEYTDSGFLQIKIVAPLFEIEKKSEREEYSIFKKGLMVFFYNKSQELIARFKSDYAIYNNNSQIWKAQGNIVAVNTKGEILQTELLYWDTQKRKIYTDNMAKVTDESSEVIGEGFTADEDFTNWEFQKVTGIIDISDKKNIAE